jgi:hypothetical protein
MRGNGWDEMRWVKVGRDGDHLRYFNAQMRNQSADKIIIIKFDEGPKRA